METITKELAIIERLVADMVEQHGVGGEDEYATAHHGDASRYGHAPEACSYCEDVKEALLVLTAAGIDVSHLRPEETE